jgi:hypothetical protein
VKLIARAAISVLLVVSCVTPQSGDADPEPEPERIESVKSYTVADVTGYVEDEFRAAASAGEAMFVAVRGLPSATSGLAAGMIESHLAGAGFSIVEGQPDELLLDRLLEQLEPMYASGSTVRLGQWTQSNYFALATLHLNRKYPTVSPSDLNNDYFSPQSEIVIYNLSSRKKIAAVHVIDFRSNVPMEESMAVHGVVTEMNAKLLELE